jgi:hypothetical protein
MHTRNKFFRFSAISTAVVFLLGCGGGEEISSKISGNSNTGLSIPSSDLASFEKKLFSLSALPATFGDVLKKKNWEFKYTSLEKIPNDAKTIIYLNANDFHLGSDVVARFLTSFKGVLIVDSNKTFSVSEGNDLDSFGSQKSFGATAAETYMKIMENESGPRGKFAPDGTAIIVSMDGKRFTPINIGDNGSLNGASPEEMDGVVDLRVIALDNVAEPSILMKSAGWESDAVVDISQIKNNYHAVGRVFVEARSSGNDRWFIETYIKSGDNEESCYVGTNPRVRCGIYPTANAKIFKSTRASDGKVTTEGWVTKQGAYTEAFGAKSMLEHKPTAANWNATERKDTDSYEVNWSTGYSIGTGASWSTAGSFGFPLSVSFSRGTTHRKTMNSWSGHEDIRRVTYDGQNSEYTRNIVSPIERVKSGVSILAAKNQIYRGFLGNNWSDETSFNAMVSRNTVGNNRDFCQATNRTLNKPKMSWEGWQPSVNTVHEFTKGYSTVVPIAAAPYYKIETGKIKMRAGFYWERQKLTYVYDTRTACGSTNYIKNRWVLDGTTKKISDIVTPPATTVQYDAGVDIWITHNQFQN